MNMPGFSAEESLTPAGGRYFGVSKGVNTDPGQSKVRLSMVRRGFKLLPPPPGVGYVCDPALQQCGCHSVSDCLNLFVSGKCSGDWACGGLGCSCTYNPPIA